jgi:hypothetical protein
MSDPFPRWPPDWVEDHDLAVEQVVGEFDDVSLASALRSDDRLLLSLSWPGGRRYLLVDPIGNDPPQALRIGDLPEDPQAQRGVDRLWSQALGIAKQLIDGDVTPPPDPA